MKYLTTDWPVSLFTSCSFPTTHLDVLFRSGTLQISEFIANTWMCTVSEISSSLLLEKRLGPLF